jgi:hypothetical protein
MQRSARSSAMARLLGMSVALWSSVGSAYAGHGGADLPGLQGALDDLCSALQITSCPQLPTVTQLVLEIAGLVNAPPDVIRFENAISPTAALNAVNPPAGTPFALPNVTPLAFISTSRRGGVASVTELGNEDADSFFYAATNGTAGLAPDTLFLVYDYPPLTRSEFEKNRFVADITIPLVVLSNAGIESEVPTKIQIRGTTGCGKKVPCVSTTAVGTFGGSLRSVDPASLGLNVNLSFKPSVNSRQPHAIIEVQAKLLVTAATDPVYFGFNPASPALPEAFSNDELGFTPGFLGLPVGVTPYAAPQTSISSTAGATFPFCAIIADDDGSRRAAVAAFYAIGTAGTTYVSAPLPTPPTSPATPAITCP